MLELELLPVDLWDVGYAAGVNGCGWVEAVGGRFLTADERKKLAAGWRMGQEDEAAWQVDMAAMTAGGAWDDIPL